MGKGEVVPVHVMKGIQRSAGIAPHVLNLGARENIKENIQTSAEESLGVHELKQNKPWFDEECLDFLDQRKRAKMQWIQDRSQSNVDFLNNVSHEVSRHFRNKKKAYMRAKIEEFETNSKIQNMV